MVTINCMACAPPGTLPEHHEQCTGWVIVSGRLIRPCGCPKAGHVSRVRSFEDTLYARTWQRSA